MKVLMSFTPRQNPAAVYRIVDHYVDTVGDVPECLKTASSPSPEELASLSDSAFARKSTREFPIHSREAAALSAIDYHAYSEPNSLVEDRIKRACDNYNILDFYETVENVFTDEQIKSASVDTVKYAFVLYDEHGERGYYPINSAFEVEQSAVSFANSLDSIPVDIAAGIAEEIVKSANEYGVNHTSLPDSVLILGEPRVMDESWAETQVRLRKSYVPDYIGEAYDEIVKSAAEGCDNKELVALMDNLDQEFIPEEVKTTNMLYRNAFSTLNSGVTVKNADSIASNFVFLHEEDVLLPAEAVQKIQNEQIDSIFSKNTAGEVKEVVKLASEDAFSATAIVNGLPADIRKDFIRLVLHADAS